MSGKIGMRSSGRGGAGNACHDGVMRVQWFIACLDCSSTLPHQSQTDGIVDQSAGMLSEDVKEKGYCLLCVAMPQSDCAIEVIEEV